MQKKYSIYFKLIVLALFFFVQSSAQEHSISLDIKDAGDSTIYLAHHFNGLIFVDDTIKLDHEGRGISKGDSLLHQGLYLIYLDKDHNIDFLLGGEQKLKIRHSFSNPNQFEVKGSDDSELFEVYKAFLIKQREKQQQLFDKKKLLEGNKDSIESINKKLEQLNLEVSNYWFSESKKYPNLFYSKFLMANYIPVAETKDIPNAWLKNDSLRWVYEYNFRKKHFWDNLDVSDKRFLYTPLLKPRIEAYFNQVLIQKPDSVIPYALDMIEKSKSNPSTFRYITSFLLNHFATSQSMGMDAVFVRIAEKYYLTGLANWTDSATLASIKLQVYFMRNNLLGMKAKELKLESIEGPFYSIHECKTDYTVLMFWEPDCGHCKKQISELYKNVYLPLKDKSMTVFAIYTMNEKEKWQKFIEEQGLVGWKNLWDPYHVSNFKEYYGVQTTPMIYILDKDKRIIAKKIDPETVKKILEYLFSGKEL